MHDFDNRGEVRHQQARQWPPAGGHCPAGHGRAGLILFGHAAFQHLNAATELNLFELLERKPALTRVELARKLGLADPANDILLLGCTSLGLLTKQDGRYQLARVVADLLRTMES